MSLFQRKILLFAGAVIMVNLAFFCTLALCRMSRWIVGHDAVWAQMDREGTAIEHQIGEVFAGGGGLLIIVEAICGVAFLGLLWHTLFRADRSRSSTH